MDSAVAALPDHQFIELMHEEIWNCGARAGMRTSRISRGQARTRVEGDRLVIDAHSSGPDGAIEQELESKLQKAFSSSIATSQLAQATPDGFTIRRVVCVRRMQMQEGDPIVRVDQVVAIRSHDSAEHVLVTTPDQAKDDLALLSGLSVHPVTRRPKIDQDPILWSRGSGAVLLHEAIGHASLAGASRIDWPAWLVVTDEPARRGLGALDIDDAGRTPGTAILSAGERPQALRRQSFRDPPLARMSNLVVGHRNAPFALPNPHLEVLLVAGGHYDPVSDLITLHVAAADRVDRNGRKPLAPFRVQALRTQLAASLVGARGEPVRYPGVFCSEEGQRVAVGSWSADLLTLPL